MELNQYTIILVNLDPTVGSEIQKTRPCVILSPQEMINTLNTVTVAPLTTANKRYPTRVPIHFQSKNGFIALDQIRTVDKSRIVRIFDTATPKTQKHLKEVLFDMLVA